MGFRFRRSMKVAPGVRLNFTHRGVGVRLGPRGAGISFHSSGRGTRSVGLPGSGMYWREDFRWDRPHAAGTRGPADDEHGGATRPTSHEVPVDDLVAGLTSPGPVLAECLSRIDEADTPTLLAWLADRQPWEDPAVTVTVTVAPGVTMLLPASGLAARHAQVEALQRQGRIDEALEAAERLPATDVAAVAVAELLAVTGRWRTLLDEFEDAPPVLSASGQLLNVYVAVALHETGRSASADLRLRRVLADDGLPNEVRLAALARRVALADEAGRDELASACRRAIARLEPGHPSLDVPSDDGREAERQAEEVRLHGLRDEVASEVIEGERYLADVTARLASFTSRYLRQVGVLMAEVDALRARLASARAQAAPHDPTVRARAAGAAEDARQSAEACVDLPSSPAVSEPASEELRAAYHAAARTMHPDLAGDEGDRATRTDFMARLNRAYTDRDGETLKRIAEEWSTREHTASTVADLSEVDRLRGEVAHLQERLVDIHAAIERTLTDPMWHLMRRAEEAADEGIDLLAQMEGELRDERDNLADELTIVEEPL